jgi:predicted site-specific integrase-resolvase
MTMRFERPGYLQVRDAAKWASVSTKTVQRWIKRGLPYFNSSETGKGRVLIRPDDLDRFLQETKREVKRINLNKLVEDTLREIIAA